MISKNSRRATGSVERLKQGSFTAVKGVDDTASALKGDAVTFLKNLDVDTDGGLKLRKPITAVRMFPKVDGNLPKHIFPLDNLRTVLVYDVNGMCVVGVVDSSNNALNLSLEWVDYNTLVETFLNPTLLSKYTESVSNLESGHFYICDYFKFENPTYVNLTTTLMLYGVQVRFAHDIFSNTLVDAELYADTEYVYRPIRFIYVDSEKYVKIIISHVELSEINFNSDIPLDTNLSLDNPYAMRDEYGQAAASIKGILPYLPSVKKDGKVSANVSYGEEEVVKFPSSTLEMYSGLALIAPQHLYDAYYTGFKNWTRLFEKSTVPSDLTLTFYTSTGINFSEAQLVRGGNLSYRFRDIDISYSTDSSVVNPKSFTLNKERVREVEYTPLCKVSLEGSPFTDILKSQPVENPRITNFSMSRMSVKASLNINYYSTYVEEEFTKEAELTFVDYGDSKPYTRKVPLLIMYLINPAYWRDSDSKNCVFKNIIPAIIAILYGFNTVESGANPLDGFRYWVHRYEDWTHYGQSYIYDTDKYIYFTLASAGFQGSTSVNAITFKLPNYNVFEVGVSNFKIQGMPAFNFSYQALPLEREELDADS